MLTCSKVYADIPFAHRQSRHPGHCHFIHGHSWTFTVTFACREPDANGFIVDFGGLKFLKAWLDDNLDHACVFSECDPERERLLLAFPGLFKPFVVENASCEGIAKHVYHVFDDMVRRETGGRAWVTELRLNEDSRNFTTYKPETTGHGRQV